VWRVSGRLLINQGRLIRYLPGRAIVNFSLKFVQQTCGFKRYNRLFTRHNEHKQRVEVTR
ncbi:MAG: hypothetical protein P8M20_02695, partial [Planctomycetaceae bacterium]|nr:hypothetical protein [Planctomycetaceae bacterium]